MWSGYRPILLLALIGVALGRAEARADASAENQAAAQALFDEARQLMQAGKPEAACPKFEESERLDPGIGTRLNLAGCYERIGKTASAWTLYVEIAPAARKAGQPERAALATERAAALKDKLTRLVIVVPEGSRSDGLAIERGTIEVGEAQWGAAIPVDPGAQTIRATAPDKLPWQTRVQLPADGSTVSVSVPALANDPLAERAREEEGSDSQRTVAYVVGGVGAAGIVVGSIFGGIAISKKGDAGCDGNQCASDARLDSYNDAQEAGTISTVAFIAGGALLATGVVLFITSGTSEDGGVNAEVAFGPGGVALRAGARW
jgi:hypothetical protein